MNLSSEIVGGKWVMNSDQAGIRICPLSMDSLVI